MSQLASIFILKVVENVFLDAVSRCHIFARVTKRFLRRKSSHSFPLIFLHGSGVFFEIRSLYVWGGYFNQRL